MPVSNGSATRGHGDAAPGDVVTTASMAIPMSVELHSVRPGTTIRSLDRRR
ncbi:hypothetical protein HSR121_1062 [Halapricum desulfuricans]|uniref:Uncharacterized protein n=1 Tax=Halapricum desulfuricans TaxID=2841257 RepID=A0A897N2S9_9EURY|nr:hypothetical protein HSR121_1062 [Halapricum desulfuricans]